MYEIITDLLKSFNLRPFVTQITSNGQNTKVCVSFIMLSSDVIYDISIKLKELKIYFVIKTAEYDKYILVEFFKQVYITGDESMSENKA